MCTVARYRCCGWSRGFTSAPWSRHRWVEGQLPRRCGQALWRRSTTPSRRPPRRHGRLLLRHWRGDPIAPQPIAMTP